MDNYMTINKAAKEFKLPERLLRQRLKDGKLPGIYAGNRFYVNTDLLMRQLEAESLSNVKHTSD